VATQITLEDGETTVACDIIKFANVPVLKQRMVTWVIAGMNGVGMQVLGKADANFQATFVKYGTPATVAAWQDAMEGAQGEIVKIERVVGGWDQVITNVLLQRVERMEIQAAWRKAGGDDGARGTVRVTGQRMN
jgi:hypothetical protein